MARLPTPLAAMDSRIPEAGRIRLGIKTGKGMTSLDTFRFTSPDFDVIKRLAILYGGEAKPWRDPKASPPDQYEVITKVKELDVYLPADALSVWYELWSGGGVQRRCDGESCQVPRVVPGGWEMSESPCICLARQQMECRPYTRMNVILPTIPFRGVWRLETKGWNAAKELPGMVNIIEAMTRQGRLVEAKLHVERRAQQTPAGKRNFVVPGVTLKHTAEDMLAGAANLTAVAAGGTGALTMAALDTPPLGSGAADIIDAEVVENYLDVLTDRVAPLAQQHGVDARRLAGAIGIAVGLSSWYEEPKADQEARIAQAIEKMEAGTLKPLGFNPNGSAIWKRMTPD